MSWGSGAPSCSEAGAAGFSEAMGEEHDGGGHADRPRASCWVCQEELEGGE